MAEQQAKHVPYKGIQDFYKTLDKEQKEKVISCSEKLDNLVKQSEECLADFACLCLDFTYNYVLGELLRIKKENGYITKKDETQEGGV